MPTVHEQLSVLDELVRSPASSQEDLRSAVLAHIKSVRLWLDELESEVRRIMDENDSLRERVATLEKQRDELLERSHLAHPGHDYQRQVWHFGWLQKDPKRIKAKRKDGEVREKTYDYWYFHWVEDGKRKSRYIGKDEQLETWKVDNDNEEALRAWTHT